MNEIGCIFCEIKSNHVVIEENGYQGKKCPQCGLIYISPRPSFDEIVDLYGHGSAHISAESHVANDFSNRLYARHHLKIIRSVIKSGALLEIGAGAGYFLDEARRIGFDPFGLELNPVQANFIRHNLNIPCEEFPLTAASFAGRKFDIVYHCDVISHLFDPISDFKKINEIMRDDAFLIFETGNIGEVDPIYFKYINCFQYPDHLFFFGVDNLRSLLDRTGFKVLKIYRYAIVHELMVIKILAEIKHLLFNSDGQPRNSDDSGKARKTVGDIQQSSFRDSKVKTVIRDVWNYHIVRKARDYFYYFLRYKIGYMAQKKYRPQTVIIVAQKRIGK